MMDVNYIAERVKSNLPVTDAERAYLIRNNPYALAAFLLKNNPGSLNYIFRNRFDYDHLPLIPNEKALQRQLELMLERKRADELKVILQNYEVRNTGLSAVFYEELKKQFES